MAHEKERFDFGSAAPHRCWVDKWFCVCHPKMRRTNIFHPTVLGLDDKDKRKYIFPACLVAADSQCTHCTIQQEHRHQPIVGQGFSPNPNQRGRNISVSSLVFPRPPPSVYSLCSSRSLASYTRSHEWVSEFGGRTPTILDNGGKELGEMSSAGSKFPVPKADPSS